MTNPYKTGDPVVDLSQGRPMIVLEAPEQTVAEWSDENNYDLTENYGNAKLGTEPDDYVVRCVYVSDIRSEPSKDYTFSESRVALIDAHHADDGRRIYDRIVSEVVEQLFITAFEDDIEGLQIDDADPILRLVHRAVGANGLVGEAYEFARAATLDADTEDSNND